MEAEAKLAEQARRAVEIEAAKPKLAFVYIYEENTEHFGLGES